MTVPEGFPARGLWRRPGPRWADVVVVAALLALLFGLLRLAPALNAPFLPNTAPAEVSTDPANLPYYAVRSLLRMFIALILSLLFTFVYATAAARLRRTEKLLIPLLDILQSVPVLGFLSVTVTAFINLFPGSELGLECASIFAIFTAMAWNMTFAFYHSLVSQPRDLDEAARVLRLTRWQRFWRLDVPSGMIPLVWNGMMSFGGAWFFLAASESISVLNHHYALPGIGSYAATAIAHGDLAEVALAVVVLIVLVIGVNFLFWRPVTAWAERFRVEESEAAERPRSLVLDLLRHSEVPELLGRPLKPVGRLFDRITRPFGLAEHPLAVSRAKERTGDVFFAGVIAVVVAYGAWQALGYVHATTGLGDLPAIFPAYVTGGITAAGGAWNASIVAEVVIYGNHHLTAVGLGAYITQATATGNFPHILVGIAVMSLYVVLVNRLLWRRLYAIAERRYSL